jgi:pimeloyl-ACP methyl ester carboxylesterase
MLPDRIVLDERRLRYAVSDNADAPGPEGPSSDPLWAVNLHGYFAGGGMYWRESANLAQRLGWRVVNPSLPGFAGSDPLPWEHVNIREMTEQIVRLLDHLGVERVLLLGHSMGGAVAVKFADMHPERTLGIVYRDGAATPGWKDRKGLLVALLSPFLPDVADVLDLLLAAVVDSPDLLIGRRLSATLRGLWPDARRNLWSMSRTLPVGSMLMALDLREEVERVAAGDIPVLPVWGCFDRIVNLATATEFSRLTGTKVLWVPGGHSWMLPRPQGQADVLLHLDAGRRFVHEVEERSRALAGPRRPAMRVVR